MADSHRGPLARRGRSRRSAWRAAFFRPGRCAAALAGTLLWLWLAAPAHAVARAPVCDARWPLWESFRSRFIEPGGRVVDHHVPELHSTSEGQAYAMFFALVAGDRPTFDLVWHWSVAVLAGGDPGRRLPAWRWGRRPDGSWDILDTNAASDADLWFAYALLEAARLWRAPAYRDAARQLMGRIALDEVAEVPGLGPMLLPAPTGFAWPVLAGGPAARWRFNPSYTPLVVLRRLAHESPHGPWQALADNSARLVRETARHGYAPDWVTYTDEDGFGPDPDSGDAGSYDAIRTYLWVGLAAPSDPLARLAREALHGMAAAVSAAGGPPEIVHTSSGEGVGAGPAGFSAALVPYLVAVGQPAQAAAQRRRAESMLATQGAQLGQVRYYDQALALFGLGWADGRYRFLSTGQLQPRWGKKGALPCPPEKTKP